MEWHMANNKGTGPENRIVCPTACYLSELYFPAATLYYASVSALCVYMTVYLTLFWLITFITE